MSPLFMETGYEPHSPDPGSAEENPAAGSERGGEGRQTGNRGRVRKETNREAARKSRRKQTERADELHEELQCLERSNSALNKEIAALRKELHLYTTALERHKPFCCLRRASASPPVDCRTTSSSPGLPPQASSSSSAAPSPSTSLTSSQSLQICDCDTNPSPLTLPPPTLASPSSSSAELFHSSSSMTSVSFSASMFSRDPASLITSRPTNDPPVCSGLVFRPVASSSSTVATQSGQHAIHESSSVSASVHFPPLRPGTLNEFLMTHTSFLTTSPTAAPPYPHLVSDNEGPVVRSCPMDVSEFNLGQSDISPPCPLLPPPPAPLDVITHSHGSLLSLLTVPSPLNTSQTMSSSFDRPQPPPLLPLFEDPVGDVSLSEFLEVNDWILSGMSHQ